VTSPKTIKISNHRVKNIVRGVMCLHNEPNTIMNALRTIEGLEDEMALKQSLLYIRSSPLFYQNGLTTHFRKFFPSRLVDFVQFTPDEIAEIISDNSERILRILHLYVECVTLAVNKNFDKSIQMAEAIIDASGVSIALLRVLYFVYNRAEFIENTTEILNKIDDIYESIQINNIADISKGIRQIIVDRADYFSICNKILTAKLPINVSHILKTFISHTPTDDKHYQEVLNAHLSFSLVDATLYVYLMNRLGFPTVKMKLPPEIELSLNRLSALPMDMSLYHAEGEEDYGLSFFREAYLLGELECNFNYKTIHGCYYNPPISNNRLKRPPELRLINSYYQSVASLADLRYQESSNTKTNFVAYCKDTCNLTENSAALAYHLNRVDGVLKTHEEDTFITLMSFTSNIAHIVDREHFTCIKNRAVSQDLRMIALCLLVDATNKKCDLTEHEFRKRLQELIMSKHDGNIVAALASMNRISSSVTQYLVQTLDETFLSRLFDLNGTTNTALETRANILEWHGELNKDQGAIDRAKNIRIDIQIHKHIQHINDSRIYADPTRVIAWINDNYINKLALALDEIIKSDSPNLTINWSKLNTAITPEYDLAQIVAYCYHEFVSNSLYGVSSYLGRRIRHGTVKGNAVTGVKDILKQTEYKSLQTDPIFMDAWNRWIGNYTQVFDDLVLKYFHVRQEGSTPHGLLSPIINTDNKYKLANMLIEGIYESFKRIDNVSEAPAMIIDSCWRLIAEDLVAVKRHLYKQKEYIAKFPISDHRKLRNPTKVQHFIHELQQVISEKFRLIDSWFNKPSYASPSAELSMLYKVAIDDVKNKSADFLPEIIEDTSNLVIYGELYFAIFDALEIMIKNVAEHGNKHGLLKFTSRFDRDAENFQELVITTTSQFSEEVPYLVAREAIEHKMASERFQNANLVDTGSGIKKLRSMQASNQIRQLRYSYPLVGDEYQLEATFSIRLVH
jgi:hypothetical protein